MTDYRQRLMTVIILTSVLLFLFLVLLLGNILGSYYKTETVENETEKLGLIAINMVGEEGRLQGNSRYLMEASEVLGGSVTLYGENGEQVSSTDPESSGLPLSSSIVNRIQDRKEIIREEETAENRYIAPVSSEGNVVGFLEWEQGTNDQGPENRFLWVVLIISLAAGFFVLLLIVSKISTSILNPLNNATAVAKELAKGNFQARSYEVRFENPGNLNHSINILARNLEQMTQRYEMQQERLETLIENLGSSLILIDSKGYVTLVNKAFKETFQAHEENWRDKLYYDLLPYEEINKLVEEVFLTETKIQRQILLPFKIERRYFDVIGAPVLDSTNTHRGSVLVFHDITELKKLEQMRKDFVANVSHELRTPVTSLKGFAETLLEGAVENKEVRDRFLTIMWNESNRLEHIIHDLLELSKVEQNGFELDWQSVDLAELLEEVVFLLQSKADKKEIELNYNVEGKCMVEGDPVRIRQIFINIINNSIAYTASGGHIFVSLTEEGDCIQSIVKDNGSGMDKEEIPRIFERFYRIDKARSRNSGGTGLGLAIVKHLVEAHGGKIHVESEKGIGTAFTIAFQKKRNTDLTV